MNIITQTNAALIQNAYDRNSKRPFPVHLPAQCTFILNALGKLSILANARKYKGGNVNNEHLKKALCNIISYCIIMLNKLDKKKVKVVIALLDNEVKSTIVSEETIGV